jgi:tellurite resistance protein
MEGNEMNIAALSGQSFQMVARVSGSSSGPVSVIKGGGASAAATTNISDAAEMLSKLNELKSSDPEKFQTTLEDMADRLRSDAKEKGGEAVQILNGLADKVDEAAKTGDLSQLASASGFTGKAVRGASAGVNGPPPGGRPPGGAPPGPRPSGVSGTSAGSSRSSTKAATVDPADANADGTVSAAEKAVYAITHPAASQQTSSDSRPESGAAAGA